MGDDNSHWLRILVSGDVTEWERDFCASCIRQVNRGAVLSEKQQAVLARIKSAFQSRHMREDGDGVVEG